MSALRWLRRPLLLWLMLGCTVSALASGRFAPRLLVDGMISFAFIPLLEIVAFAAIFRRAAPAMDFRSAFDAYCEGDRAWLLWLVALSAVVCVVPSRPLMRCLLPLEVSALAPMVSSWRADSRFFRETLGQPARAARLAGGGIRAIAWGAGVAYFFGIALWSDQLPAFARWLTR